MIKEIIRELIKKEDEIIKNMKNKAVINIDTEMNGKIWRMKTEYTKNEKTGEISIKKHPMILIGGTKWKKNL